MTCFSHVRAVLFDLDGTLVDSAPDLGAAADRMRLAREADGQVELTAEGFVPLGDRRGMLAFLGDNNADHLMAAISNTLGQSTPFLERAVFADGMTRKACEDLQLLARQQWSAMHHALVDQMTVAVDEVADKKTMRMRVGVYAYFEETPPPPRANDAAANSAPS